MKIKAKDIKIGDYLIEAKSEIVEIIKKKLKNGKEAYILIIEKNGLTGSYLKKSETMVNIKK